MKLLLQQIEPLVNDLGRWEGAVVVLQVMDVDPFVLQLINLVRGLADANHAGRIVLLQFLQRSCAVTTKLSCLFWAQAAGSSEAALPGCTLECFDRKACP